MIEKRREYWDGRRGRGGGRILGRRKRKRGDRLEEEEREDGKE